MDLTAVIGNLNDSDVNKIEIISLLCTALYIVVEAATAAPNGGDPTPSRFALPPRGRGGGASHISWPQTVGHHMQALDSQKEEGRSRVGDGHRSESPAL